VLNLRRVWNWVGPSVAFLFLAMSSCRTSEPAGDNEVRILMKEEDSNNTKVAAQAAPGDANGATLLQERIAENAGRAQARTGLLGGDSLDGVYSVTLVECLQVGRRSFGELQVALRHQEYHETWVALDGYQGDSTPVRIKGQSLGEMKTRVLFTVGTESTRDHKAFVRTLKEMFERQLTFASAEDD
jgi:hypothetical protein